MNARLGGDPNHERLHGSVKLGPMGAGGTYTLLIEVPESITTDVGGLGRLEFAAGWYAYTGSALGAGGFARIERHRDVASTRNGTRHWHLDYLLGEPSARIADVVRSTGYAIECAVNRGESGTAVPGFGASDCDCDSHLRYYHDRENATESIEQAHTAARMAADSSHR